MIEFFIFPYSGSGLEVLDAIKDNTKVAFISDDHDLIGSNKYGINIYNRNEILKHPRAKLILVHGSASSFSKREEIIKGFNLTADRFATIIHPSAIISKYSTIGKNVFISAGVIIGPNTIIEDNVIILAGSIVHHDSIIKKNTMICGKVLIAGNVTINPNSYIGAGSNIKNGIEIGQNVLIGMGSLVLKNISNNQIKYGNPVK